MQEKKKYTPEPERTSLIIRQSDSICELTEKYPIGTILIKRSISEYASDIWWKVLKIDEQGVHCTLYQVIPPHIKKLPPAPVVFQENAIDRGHADQRVLPKHIEI